MKLRVLSMVFTLFVFASCVKNKIFQANQQAESNGKSVKVEEVIQGSSYTYIRGKEGNEEKWMAVTSQEIQTGEVYYYDQGLQMNNFTSKELNRTFDVIYFVGVISKTPIVSAEKQMSGGMGSMGSAAGSHSGKVAIQKNETVKLEKKTGEVTVAQLYTNRNDYTQKEFEIRGIVVKINEQVMGKNWVHIQDGTADGANFDLTVTTNELPAVNDEITFKGKLTLNKDFGYGYSYEVIMEDAVVVAKKPAGQSM